MSDPSPTADRSFANATADEKSVELSARRTGMSFQRTRLSADRTLMSVIRTSLSLIGFGFTIFQVFQQLHKAGVLTAAESPRRFGEALVGIGIAMLVVGIWYHVRFMLGLRHERIALKSLGLIHGESQFPTSMVLIVALVLLALGIWAIVNMTLDIGPFG
jgi:putative membrane protein